jgi:hypothetical protein
MTAVGQVAVLVTCRTASAGRRQAGRAVARHRRFGYRPAARRAASSICAVPKTRTIAAIVEVSFAGSVTVGCGGHLINMAAGVSGGWTSSITSRSDRLTDPAARNLPESLDRELSVRPRSPTRLSFPQMQIICPPLDRKPLNLSNPH